MNFGGRREAGSVGALYRRGATRAADEGFVVANRQLKSGRVPGRCECGRGFAPRLGFAADREVLRGECSRRHAAKRSSGSGSRVSPAKGSAEGEPRSKRMLTEQRGFAPPRSPGYAESTVGEPAAGAAVSVTDQSCSKRGEPGPEFSRTARMKGMFP